MTDQQKYEPMIGIFFKVGSELITDLVPVHLGEPYADAIQYGGHYEFHERMVPVKPHDFRFKAHEYDYYPRGRVVFFPKQNSYVLYRDPCLSPGDICKIIGVFALDGQAVRLATDEHYCCAVCNPEFME